MSTAPDRFCIICNRRKPSSQFEKKGEHIVPRFLGNRRMRTPFVCKTCNGALGGTVDLALKNAPGVAAACFNRMTPRTRGDHFFGQPVRQSQLFWEYYGCSDQYFSKHNQRNDDPLKAPNVKGALLKIAYESTHLRLGDVYLSDPTAMAIRDILSAFVNKDKDKAYELINVATLYPIDINAFHAAVQSPRCELVKKAISGKSCLNSIWITTLAPKPGCENEPLAIVTDIDGLPPAYVPVSESNYGIDAAELIFPRF